MLFEVTSDRKQGRLQIQRVKRGLGQKQIDATIHKSSNLFEVRLNQLIKSHSSKGWIVYIGESDAVLFAGPIAPATKRGRPGFFAVTASTPGGPTLAAAKFRS